MKTVLHLLDSIPHHLVDLNQLVHLTHSTITRTPVHTPNRNILRLTTPPIPNIDNPKHRTCTPLPLLYPTRPTSPCRALIYPLPRNEQPPLHLHPERTDHTRLAHRVNR
jgi:hypothetical protein